MDEETVESAAALEEKNARLHRLVAELLRKNEGLRQELDAARNGPEAAKADLR